MVEMAEMEQFRLPATLLQKSCVQECVKITKKVRLHMWFVGENESFNAQFIWKNIIVRGMPISIQNYKIMFSSLFF